MELFDVYPLFDIDLVKGQGSRVWDKNGRSYLDLYGGHAVISIGHSHPHYVERITRQLNQLGFYSNSVQNNLQSELAEKLGKLSGCDEYRLFLCNSGAEANENALKLASFHNGRKKIVAFEKGFHGRTSLAVAATDNASIIAPVNALHDIQILPLNDEAALESTLQKGDVAAVVVEGIQGVGGVEMPTDGFLKRMRQLCDKYNTVMVLDEVQSGYGRSGKFFAFQHSGVKPDIISVAKGMGNGFPIGGILIGPPFKAKHGLLGTTFGGNHLACAAGLAVLEVIESENLLAHATEIGQYLVSRLKNLDGIKRILGSGLMIGLELETPCAEVRTLLLKDHAIFTGSSSNKNTMRILPALNLSREDADAFIKALGAVLSKSSITDNHRA